MAVKHTVAHNCPHSEISTDRDKSRKTHGARDRREIAVRGGGGGGGRKVEERWGSVLLWFRRGSYLVLKYALMVAGDPFITGRKQKGVSLLI